MSLTPKLLQQGAAGSARPVYIEDVFSTYLYTGNAGTQTITNDIDLFGKGGLVWIKSRFSGVTDSHGLFDTVRGVRNALFSDSTSAQTQVGASAGVTNFGATGFTTVNNGSGGSGWNNYLIPYVSWTFRKQAKFFDVVTWTGDNSSTRQINHNLGATPAFIIIKRTDTTSDWIVAARKNNNTYSNLRLNNTDAELGSFGAYPTGSAFTSSTQLGVGWWSSAGQATLAETNATGGTYVAYLFAHNAGGFGLTGSDNVISCGSATTDVNGNWTSTLGYEPQWVLWKSINTGSTAWEIIDNMRNFSLTDNLRLFPNSSNTEANAAGPYLSPNATGYSMVGSGGPVSGTIIYMAIRRGPMKVPTDATKVYKPVNRIGTGDATTVSGVGFPPDLLIAGCRTNTESAILNDRLRGKGLPFYTDSDVVERAGQNLTLTQDGWNTTSYTGYDANQGTITYVNWFFRRAPSFFDIVCYTGTGSGTQTISHNLGVTPELTINKSRSGTRGWTVYYNNTTFLRLNQTNAGAAESLLSPTSTTFNAALGAGFGMNAAETYVTFLFASCPGVSKVGSYTGNGSTQTINCGFAAGARFILIKRTNASGDWYVFDSIRGILSGNDPFLTLNTNGFDTSSYDAVDPANSGFIVNNDATNFPINVASATYIFLAIA